MEAELLIKFKNEFLNKKTELESKRNSLVIQMEEKKKYLEKLMEEDRYNFDAFSPRNQNKNLKENIVSLEEEKNELNLEVEEITKEIEYWNEKILEIDSELENQKQEFSHETNSDFKAGKEERNQLSDILHRITLCHQLCLVDPKRCKIELSLVLEKLNRIVLDDN